MTNAYIVAGPESSGNRLVAAILVRSGCRGEGSTNQPKSVDELQPDDGTPYVIIAHHNLMRWIDALRSMDYRVHVVVVIREPVATIGSQVARGHIADPQRAYMVRSQTIARTFEDTTKSGVATHVVTYEGLCESALKQWLPLIGLEYASGPLDLRGQDSPDWITNENEKHYQE